MHFSNLEKYTSPVPNSVRIHEKTRLINVFLCAFKIIVETIMQRNNTSWWN